MIFGNQCVFECRHPLSGGRDTCSKRAGPVDDGEGYLATESFGSPSCVSGRGLLGCYLSVTLCEAAAVGFLQITAMKQQRLSTGTRSTRRARLRFGLIRWARCALHCCCSVALLFVAGAGSVTDCSHSLWASHRMLPFVLILVTKAGNGRHCLVVYIEVSGVLMRRRTCLRACCALQGDHRNVCCVAALKRWSRHGGRRDSRARYNERGNAQKAG